MEQWWNDDELKRKPTRSIPTLISLVWIAVSSTQVFQTKVLHAFQSSSIRATCSAHFIIYLLTSVYPNKVHHELASSNPAKGDKHPQHAFPRSGSKAIGTMSKDFTLR
jgi:hypothetical protein